MSDLAILFLVLVFIDYIEYRRGSDAIFFKDRNDLEKDRRKIQHIKLKLELQELESKLPQENPHAE